jgi:uncharacterized protein (DUF3820 family)
MNNIDRKMPEDFAHLLSQVEYEGVLDHALAYFAEKGFPVVKIADGVIIVDYVELKNMQFGLDNLIRTLANEPNDRWQSLIYSHFDRFKNNTAAYNYLFADLGYAQQFLKVLVKGEGFAPKMANLVRRQDFPETYTYLVLDFENQFRFINRDDAAKWEVAEAELFEIALANVAKEEIEIGEGNIAEKYDLFTFFSSDFSAAYLINFTQNASFADGDFGAMLAIPAKGAAFVHPVNGNGLMFVLETLAPLVIKFCEEEPGGINANFYWYYQGRFELFPRKDGREKGYISIGLPKKLERLLDEIDLD